MADDAMPASPRWQLSDADSIMWRIAADPVLRSPILVVGLLDRVPDAEQLAATFGPAGAFLPGEHVRGHEDAVDLVGTVGDAPVPASWGAVGRGRPDAGTGGGQDLVIGIVVVGTVDAELLDMFT